MQKTTKDSVTIDSLLRRLTNMKKSLLLVTASLTLTVTQGQTNIPAGNVYGTWTLAGSPYMVQGNIQVPNDSTLIIDPGVTVSIQGFYWISVHGRLLAIGNLTDTISFTPVNTSTGWQGFYFDNTPTNDTSKCAYCKIEYAKATGYGGGIEINNTSKVIISNSVIKDCKATYGGGIACWNGSSPIILNNLITNNGFLSNGSGGGIYCDNNCNPLISGNTISNNSTPNNGGGIYCSPNCNSIISNNIITNNTASASGGGIFCSNASPAVTSNTILNNTSLTGAGGGIYCNISSSNIIGNTISGNTAKYDGGGIYFLVGNTVIDNNTITNNSLQQNGHGGGIYCEANATITNNVITNNFIPFPSCNYCGAGGGIYCKGNVTLISNNTISANTVSSGYGGGIYNDSTSANITNNTINNNIMTNGGGAGIFTIGAAPIISYNTISNNKSTDWGAIYCYSGTNNISNNIITYNTGAAYGGGIFCSVIDTADISNNTINNNVADYGGGIYTNSPSIQIVGNVISNDSAYSGGGGIYCGNYYGPLIRDNIIDNNYGGGGGGGIFCDGSSFSLILNNFITNNSAATGGGIHCSNDSSTIIGNVIANNTAFINTQWGSGGGIYCYYSDSKIYNCTIANNDATTTSGGGGGGFAGVGTAYPPFIRNTIFWGNTSTSGTANLFNVNINTYFDKCDIEGGGFPGNNINILPLFISPSTGSGINFNGLSSNWALQNTSPCINAGDTTGLFLPATDIAGLPRVFNQIDIGAYEWQSGTSVSQDHNYYSTISIYPNPFASSTTLQTATPLKNTSLTVYNSVGQTVKRLDNLSGQTVLFHRDNLPSGLYFVRLTQDGKTFSADKFVIVDE